MEKWINMTETTCVDPAREQEFNDWFDNIHVPDVLKTPGYVSARRFVIKEPKMGRGKYLAIYEIETDDIEKTLALRDKYKKIEEEQRRSFGKTVANFAHISWRLCLFKQIGEHTQ